jgi:hypothetical protein
MSKAAPFPILNDDPIPARTYAPRGARGSIYPLEQTVEGQSFLVEVRNEELEAARALVARADAAVDACAGLVVQAEGKAKDAAAKRLVTAEADLHEAQQVLEIEESKAVDRYRQKAAQKRSYLSALGKSRGIKIKTVFYPEGKPAATGKWKGQPTVQCWNMGAREMVESPSSWGNPPRDPEDGQDEAE